HTGPGADDRRVRVRAQRARQHRDGGKAAAPTEHAQRIARVLAKLLEPAATAGVARIVLVPGDAAESPPRRAPCVLVTQSGQLRGFHLEMEAHLLLHLALDRRAVDDEPRAAAKSGKPAHARLG